jgi:hypothetical protein
VPAGAARAMEMFAMQFLQFNTSNAGGWVCVHNNHML